jgi:hypothetical protein
MKRINSVAVVEIVSTCLLMDVGTYWAWQHDLPYHGLFTILCGFKIDHTVVSILDYGYNYKIFDLTCLPIL